MARKGPWSQGTWQDLYGGMQQGDPQENWGRWGYGQNTNRTFGNVRNNMDEYWGAGGRWNYLQRWQDPSTGDFMDPDSGIHFPSWNEYQRFQTDHRYRQQTLDEHANMGGNVPNDQEQTGNPPGGGGGWPGGGGGGGGWGGGGNGGFPQDAYNMGGGAYPWLQGYQGQYTAPMSPYEQDALGGFSDFIHGENGGGPSERARGYYGDVLQGDYLGGSPYMDQIEQGLDTSRAYQDAGALRRIGSSMAAGGNALSGARAGAEADYLGRSNADFNTMIGTMRHQNYMNERQLQDAAARGDMNAADQLARMYGQYSQMGALPRELQQHDYNSQYADWIRQTQEYKDQFRYPDRLALEELHAGYPGSSNPNYGNSTADQLMPILAMLLGGSGSGGGGVNWGNILNNLFGGNKGQTPQQGGGGGGGGGSYDPNSPFYNPYGNRTNDPGGQMYDEPIGPQQPDGYNDQTPYGGGDQFYGPYLPPGNQNEYGGPDDYYGPYSPTD